MTLQCCFLAQLHLEILARDVGKIGDDLRACLKNDALEETVGPLKEGELFTYQHKFFSQAIVGLLNPNQPHKEVKEGLKRFVSDLIDVGFRDGQSNHFCIVGARRSCYGVSHLFNEFYVDFGMSQYAYRKLMFD